MAAEPVGLFGYRRPGGRVGVRNHVAIIPVDDLSNAVCENVAKVVPGTLALPHHYGRLQYGEDLELTFRTLIGNGANPNVAAAVVVCIEPNWAQRIAEGIAKTGKPVESYSIERFGDLKTMSAAARTAQQMVQDASELRRVPIERHEVMISIKCGESDTTTGLGSCPTVSYVVDRHIEEGGTVLFGETTELTGGEHLIAQRCANNTVRARFQAMYDGYIEEIERSDANLLGSQPTQGNIRGGLSTIEEKALGNIAKTGHFPVVDALEPGIAPAAKGLNFVDSSSAAAEFITLMGAAGAVVHLFPTGQGNIVGNPIVPTIKLTANPLTARSMSEHIDVDVSGLLWREYNLTDAGERLLAYVDRVINGRVTCAESLGHREFVITKLYRSA
jgi:(2R)-sulfolactate sulfo-lyase subunit beta